MNGSYMNGLKEINPMCTLLEEVCPQTRTRHRATDALLARLLKVVAVLACLWEWLSRCSVRRIVRTVVLIFCFGAIWWIVGSVEEGSLSLETGLLCGAALVVAEIICVR